jgi:hypothetical protein
MKDESPLTARTVATVGEAGTPTEIICTCGSTGRAAAGS